MLIKCQRILLPKKYLWQDQGRYSGQVQTLQSYIRSSAYSFRNHANPSTKLIFCRLLATGCFFLVLPPLSLRPGRGGCHHWRCCGGITARGMPCRFICGRRLVVMVCHTTRPLRTRGYSAAAVQMQRFLLCVLTTIVIIVSVH